MFDSVFIQILNMTWTASLIITAVMLIRLPLKKSPKLFSYALWAVVLFRLLCPFTFESTWGLIPGQAAVGNYSLIDENVSFSSAAAAAWEAVGDAANGGSGILAVPLEKTSENEPWYTLALRWEVWILFGKYVWVAGITMMLFYSLFSLLKLRSILIGAVKLRDNIWIADGVESPFVMGILRPGIYLPSTLTEREQGYIILHEQTHIRRGDHIIKILSFAALCIHWMNPLVWVAFILSGRDMEMSCDESVMLRFGLDIRREYSASLLNLATGRRVFAATPLAFGEGSTGGRIRNILRFKKPSGIIIAVSAVLVIALSVGFALNWVSEPDHPDLRSFSANGYVLGGTFDFSESLAEAEPLDSGDLYDYNYEGIRLSLDVNTGLINKMNIDVRDGLYSQFLTSCLPGWNETEPLRSADDIRLAMSGGKYGWHDKEQRLRYVEYRQSDEGKTTKIRFIYTDSYSDGIKHRLIQVTATSDYQYNAQNTTPQPSATPPDIATEHGYENLLKLSLDDSGTDDDKVWLVNHIPEGKLYAEQVDVVVELADGRKLTKSYEGFWMPGLHHADLLPGDGQQEIILKLSYWGSTYGAGNTHVLKVIGGELTEILTILDYGMENLDAYKYKGTLLDIPQMCNGFEIVQRGDSYGMKIVHWGKYEESESIVYWDLDSRTWRADTTTLVRTEIISLEGISEEIRTRLYVSPDGYSFYYDFERYDIAVEESKTLIYPINDPDKRLAYAAIEHMPDVSPEESESVENTAVSVTFIPDNSGGCYALSIWYTLEASEGHGVRLKHILNTFSVTPEQAEPHTYFEGYDKFEVEAFAGDIKKFIETGDKWRLSNMINYPINVIIDNQKVLIGNAQQFVEKYEIIANEAFISAISEASVKNMFSNYMGIMIGNGDIWFGYVSDKDGLWIYAINNGSDDYYNQVSGMPNMQ